MRIIAGAYKGRRLTTPRGETTRPTADQVRIALLDALMPWLPEARVLDLFAGAGTMGLEALSRGAAHATFVERGAPALDALRRNVDATRFADGAEIVNANVVGFLDRLESAAYDIVFVDPPFADVAVMEATLAHPNLRRALAPNAIVVARVLRKHPPVLPAFAQLFRTRRIGEEDLLFLRYSGVGGGG